MIKDTTGIIQAGASATPANNFTLDASAANGTAKLYSGNAGTPLNTVLAIDAAGGLTPIAPMHTAAVTPIFSAYQTVPQAMGANVSAKINFQTKEFDTTGAFDNVTNMRYTPLVAGYYQVNSVIAIASSVCAMQITLYKNGSGFKMGNQSNSTGLVGISVLVFMNGTTDYLEIYGNVSVAQNILNNPIYTYFQAALTARV